MKQLRGKPLKGFLKQPKAPGRELVFILQSIRYNEADYPNEICLVVGHEDHGVTKRTLAACDMVIFLPMYGAGASLNVHVSLGVAAYHILHHI